MMRSLRFFLVVAAVLLGSTDTFAASGANLCSELSRHFVGSPALKLPDPSRRPSESERRLVEQSSIELLERTDYAMEVLVVDADNDGREDLVAWNIQGSGRFVSAEVFSLPSQHTGRTHELVRKVSLPLGVLQEPQFVQFQGTNYVVSTDTGDADGMTVGRLAKATGGSYELHTVCVMRARLKAKTSCRHPACKTLQALVEDLERNEPFLNVAWPHKYVPSAGLEVYFPEDGSSGDFDNSGNPTTVWRMGRQGYIYQHIYWAWLGQGPEAPQADPSLRPLDDSRKDRRVLPGSQHDRLRRTLAQQSEALSGALHQPVSLPNMGEFFLFSANKGRTYWAWDFGEPPNGDEIHITYTNAKRSDYIGTVRVMRSRELKPCVSACVLRLDL
jgi:hypothetical protein